MPAGRRDRSGPARYQRTVRINQVLREVLADEIERLADVDERLRLLTVTAVETATDLRRATVFFASLPDDAVGALEYQRIRLQKVVAGQVRMKWTPQLAFEADPGVHSGNKIEEILRQLRQNRGEPSTGDGEDALGGTVKEAEEVGQADAIGQADAVGQVAQSDACEDGAGRSGAVGIPVDDSFGSDDRG